MVLSWFSPWTLQKFKWFSVIQGHSACVGQQRGRNNTLAGEGSICYTGDSGSHDAIVELAKGCDILIIWGEDLMKLDIASSKVSTIEAK
jgi:ribonuclease BN (tRNA processing enzyme)